MDKNRLFREEINTPMIVDYLEMGNLDSQNVLLILHGYGENAEIIENSFKDLVKDNHDYHIIIPNGPFPIPKVRNDNVLYRFAWYFFNKYESRYFIDFDIPRNILKNLLLNIAPSKDVTILGYSQGGYLAPFVGDCIKLTKTIIGINCKFRDDMLPEKLDFNIYHIHNRQDPIVDYLPALEGHNQTAKKTTKEARHYGLESNKHEITEEVITTVKSLL